MRFLVFLSTLLLFCTAAYAQKGNGTSLGLVVGDPNGLTVKLPLQSTTALDLRLGVDNNGSDDAVIQLQWIKELAQLSSGGSARIPLYFGAGGAILFNNNNNLDLAARVPLGINIEFRQAPIDVFVEAAFILTIIDNDDNNDVALRAAAGVRFRL